jgi:hypothetical protein
VNLYGKPHRRTTIWLGSDDGTEGMAGYGYDVHREDAMVSVSHPGRDDNDEELEIFILGDLFPKIRAAMDAAERRECASRLADKLHEAVAAMNDNSEEGGRARQDALEELASAVAEKLGLNLDELLRLDRRLGGTPRKSQP